MFDLVAMLTRALKDIGPGPVALAAPYQLSDYHCRTLVEAGAIQGYVLADAPNAAPSDSAICGWWTNRVAGCWVLRDTAPPTILMFSVRHGEKLSGQMLLEARQKGVRRVLLADVTGAIVGEIDTAAELIEQLDRAPVQPRYGEGTYENMFAMIHDHLGGRLRLPPDAFVPNRVMLVVDTLGAGGAERQVAYTAAGLKRHGNREVFVACSHLDPPNDLFRPMVEEAGVHICVVPPYDGPANDPGYETTESKEFRTRMSAFDNLAAQSIFHQIFHYAALLHNVRPSVVHMFLDYCNVLAGVAAEAVGVPNLVLSGRSMAPDYFPQNVYQPYMKPGYLSLYGRRKLLFLNNSVAGAKDYARWLNRPESDFRVVHNGFEFPPHVSAEAREAVRRQYSIPADAFVLGSLTRFSEEKNPRLLIDTAEILSRRYPAMRFLVFGSGPLLDEMRAQVASLGLPDIIVLPGTTGDAWQALAAMDVFALTSRMEGLSNVLVEAQACGLPVVCTGVGGMPETYDEGRTGFSVPAQTPEAIAAVVARLHDDPSLRAEMSQQAHRFVRERFGIDGMLSRTIEAYEDIAAVRPLPTHRRG